MILNQNLIDYMLKLLWILHDIVTKQYATNRSDLFQDNKAIRKNINHVTMEAG